MDLSFMREEYLKEPLHKKDLAKNPFLQFEHWFADASHSQIAEANAFSLATVSKEGKPSQRTVLLKMYDEKGFIFFTNYNSQKAQEIEQNTYVSAHFAWLELARQVRIEGTAKKISSAASLKYFLSRPKGSQLGAWVSQQSQVVNTRTLLEEKFLSIKKRFQNKEIPFPEFWGGYIIVPARFEFWQGGHDRLHDRFVYTQEENVWQVKRLQP